MRSEAARLIAERAPGDLNKVFFTNGGAEAIENAVRMARLHTGRHKVLTAYRSYHGDTATAIQLTGDPRRWPNDGGATGVVHFFGPYLYRSPFWSDRPSRSASARSSTSSRSSRSRGRRTIAAIVLETIPGTAGILVPPAGYLAGVREICDRYGIVYIADEVMAGFGRAGEWFAVDNWDVTPDLITFAKGVNSGYVPLGGVVISDAIAATFAERPFPGGLTYSGHPLACAAAVATIKAMQDEGIVENARRDRARTCSAPACASSPSGTPSVGEVRGLGVFWALDLVRDKATREPLVPYNAAGAANAPMAELVAACKSARPAAVRQLQPAARRAAVHDHRGGGQGGPGDPRRGARRGGRAHDRLTALSLVASTLMSYDIFFVRRDPGQTIGGRPRRREESYEGGDPGPLDRRTTWSSGTRCCPRPARSSARRRS